MDNVLKFFGSVFLIVASLYIAMEITINLEFYRQIKEQGIGPGNPYNEQVEYFEEPLNIPDGDPDNPFESNYYRT